MKMNCIKNNSTKTNIMKRINIENLKFKRNETEIKLRLKKNVYHNPL